MSFFEIRPVYSVVVCKFWSLLLVLLVEVDLLGKASIGVHKLFGWRGVVIILLLSSPSIYFFGGFDRREHCVLTSLGE